MAIRADDGDPGVSDQGKTPYGIFLAVMTVFSLVTTAALAVEWAFPFVTAAPSEILLILEWVDLFFCGLFFVDWGISLARAPRRARYLFGERPGRSIPYGVVELFGAIPFVFFFRLLRLFRLYRMGWHASDLTPRALYRAVLASRTESAVLITFIVAFLVMVLGSMSVLVYEYDEPLATIDTANDAFWWAFVTITTVGYGDQVPITSGGRAVASLTMIVGIGIFGVIAGSLASLFTAGRSGGTSPASGRGSTSPASGGSGSDDVAAELAALRAEIADLRHMLQAERDPGM